MNGKWLKLMSKTESSFLLKILIAPERELRLGILVGTRKKPRCLKLTQKVRVRGWGIRRRTRKAGLRGWAIRSRTRKAGLRGWAIKNMTRKAGLKEWMNGNNSLIGRNDHVR